MHIAKLQYSVGFLATDDIARRVPRARQSAAAAELLTALEFSGSAIVARTKSHSRTGIAAAVGSGTEIGLGIDIEYIALDRPLAAMSKFLFESSRLVLTSEQFYRAWTFGEAYYKAFQSWPPQSAFVTLLDSNPVNKLVVLPDGVHVFAECWRDTFQLSLVWHCKQSVVPSFFSPKEADRSVS